MSFYSSSSYFCCCCCYLLFVPQCCFRNRQTIDIPFHYKFFVNVEAQRNTLRIPVVFLFCFIRTDSFQIVEYVLISNLLRSICASMHNNTVKMSRRRLLGGKHNTGKKKKTKIKQHTIALWYHAHCVFYIVILFLIWNYRLAFFQRIFFNAFLKPVLFLLYLIGIFMTWFNLLPIENQTIFLTV